MKAAKVAKAERNRAEIKANLRPVDHSPRKLKPMVHVATIRQTLNLETGEKSEPVMTIADGGPPTISRTYQREFKGNGATQRGKMMQITVTFTPDQFNVLVERARLYGSSLAETVRKCVLSGPLHSLT